MQQFFHVILFVVLGARLLTQNINDKTFGQWTDDNQARLIEFVKNYSAYEAIIRAADLYFLIGKQQITSLGYAQENDYRGGALHIIQKDRTAKCLVKLLSENQLELKVSMGSISKSAVWTQVSQKI